MLHFARRARFGGALVVDQEIYARRKSRNFELKLVPLAPHGLVAVFNERDLCLQPDESNDLLQTRKRLTQAAYPPDQLFVPRHGALPMAEADIYTI
jgi:hypothetical protein